MSVIGSGDGEAICIGCSCTDSYACEGGCYWLRVDYDEGSGVCSSCAEHVHRWDGGDREPS